MERRKRQRINYAENPTSSSPPYYFSTELDLPEFTSKLTYHDGILLKMDFINVSRFEDLLNHQSRTPRPTLFDLPDFGPDKILLFDSSKNLDLNDEALAFMIKLRFVLENNIQDVEAPREEVLIDDMCTELFRGLKYNDARNFIIKPCTLRLRVGERSLAAYADREGRKGTSTIWIIQESKHIGVTDEKSDVQIASCMIAAAQRNSIVDSNYVGTKFQQLVDGEPINGGSPTKKPMSTPVMLGIKVMGDKFYFYSMNIIKEYMEQLNRGLPNDSIKILKYGGLRLSIPEEREKIIDYLWRMRDSRL